MRRNANITDAQRQKYLHQRVIEEKAKADAIWYGDGQTNLGTNPGTDLERLRDYLDTKVSSDQISMPIMVGIFHEINSKNDYEAKWKYRLARDNISQMLGKIQDGSESIVVGRKSRVNDLGDKENVYFNADKEKQLEEMQMRANAVIEGITRHSEKRITNVNKDKRVRRKIMKQEQANNSGVQKP